MGTNFLDQAKVAAKETIKVWIKRALRESFLQALRQAWTLQSATSQTKFRGLLTSSSSSSSSSSSMKGDNSNDKAEFKVELSMDDVKACFSLVDRVSKEWQAKLRQEQHKNVAKWVVEVYQQGKPTLWVSDDNNDNNDNETRHQHSRDTIFGKQQQQQQPHNKNIESLTASNLEPVETQPSIALGEADQSEHSLIEPIKPYYIVHNYKEDISLQMKTQKCHPWVYNKLRSLGRKTELNSPSLSISDALNEIKDFTRNHPTYWPLDTSIIDQESLNMSKRMRARDQHGSSGKDGSYTKKMVQFKVVPKAVWEHTQQQQQQFRRVPPIPHHQNDEHEHSGSSVQLFTAPTQEDQQNSTVETLLLARKKKNINVRSKTHSSLQQPKKKMRIGEQHDMPRLPFDSLTSSNGNPAIYLSLQEKKELDRLLVLNEDEVNNNRSTETETTSTSPPHEISLGLFGGLQHVGQTNHMLQNPSEYKNNGLVFNCSRNSNNANDKITRRKQKISIQERLDPNRRQLRDETPKKSKSKFLKTENWFDNQKKYFDLDLGWCLLEITEGHEEGRSQKRLCAFSSMEICLNDND